jgi:hypothetical protein
MLRPTPRGEYDARRSTKTRNLCTTKALSRDRVMLPASMSDIEQVRFYGNRRATRGHNFRSSEFFLRLQVAVDFISMLAGEVDNASQSSAMTVHAPKLLTPEEFASLIEVAVSSPTPTIPAAHLSKLVTLGYVTTTAKGLVVTGDGLIRITESE